MDHDDIEPSNSISRRAALTGLTGGVALAGAAALFPGSASAATAELGPPASVQRLFASFLKAKSASDVDRTMSFFSRTDMTYWDATAGFDFPNWDALKAVFAHYMPTWGPDAHSYATNLLGSSTGAALFFTNTPQEFGAEIRGISVVDIRDGKFVRWIDYWDGRHYGLTGLAAFRSPPAQFPRDFGWSLPGEHASPRLKKTVTELSGGMARGDDQDVAGLFDENGVLEDLTLHTAVAGPQSIARYLKLAIGSIPNGRGAVVRHIVGGDGGGAYEWTNQRGSVPRGVSGIQLNTKGKIVRLSSMWDGSLVEASWLGQLMQDTIES